MNQKQKKRIDISEDPLFFNHEPILQLRKLKQKRTIDPEIKSYTTSRRKQSLELQNSYDFSLTPLKAKKIDHKKIMDYIRVQNREINQVKLKQKELNRSRILPSPLEKIKDDSLPSVDQYLFRRTINNIVRKSQKQQENIKQSIHKIETCIPKIDSIKDIQYVHTSQQNPLSSKRKTTRNNDHSFPTFRSEVLETVDLTQQRDRSTSLKKTIQECIEYRDKKVEKVNEIIYKTEESREKSMAVKLFVYSEKPDSIQPTKKQLQQLRYKWVRKLKYKIELHKKQLSQFMSFLEYLKNSDDKVEKKDQLYLQYYRDKLEIGDHLSDSDIQQMVKDDDTHEIGKLLSQYISVSK